MRRVFKELIKGSWVLSLIICAGIASAHAPVVTLDAVAPLAYENFPQAYNITGTLKHAQIQDVRDLALWVNGVQESIIAIPYVIGDTDPSAFSLPWNIAGEGIFTVQVKARHGAGGQTGSSTPEEVVITTRVFVCEEGQVGTYPNCAEPEPEICPLGYTGMYPFCVLVAVPVLDCPAAPSYAAPYLKVLGVKAGSKAYKNAVSLVAGHMGPQKIFDGVGACHPEYKEVIQGFIDDLVVLRVL